MVGGYSPSTVVPRAIGALVAGYYRDGKLIYAGRVGTGYTRTVAKDLWKRLHPLEIAKPPFDEIPPVEARSRDVRWVEPKTVIESHFRGWTSDSIVRQAAFKGVREDKPAKEVVRELPAERGDAARSRPARRGAGLRHRSRRNRSPPPSRRRLQGRVASVRQPLATAANEGGVRFTHPDRVYWADVGVTKQDLADYYTVGVGSDGAACRERAAEPAAMPRRHQGRMLLPEARVGGPQRRAAAQRHRHQAPAGDRGREPRRAAVAGAGGRAGSACARLDDRPARSLRPHRVRHRSGTRYRLGRYRRAPRARCASGSRPSISKAS